MADELYSNCVILEFDEPITKHQVEVIKRIIKDNSNNHFQAARLPKLKTAICAEREGNYVVPTIATDED